MNGWVSRLSTPRGLAAETLSFTPGRGLSRRDIVDRLVELLEGPDEPWKCDRYTITLPNRGVSLWIANGWTSIGLYDGNGIMTCFKWWEKRRIWKAFKVALMNDLGRRLQ